MKNHIVTTAVFTAAKIFILMKTRLALAMAGVMLSLAVSGAVRSYQPDLYNVFVGNSNFEIGLSLCGAFGTTAGAPTSGDVVFHP